MIRAAAIALAILLSAVINLIAIDLLVYAEAQAPPAIVPISASVMIGGGVLARKMWIAWIGLIILLAFSVLFLFSGGGPYLPAAFVLWFLLIIIQVTQAGLPTSEESE